ncbi:MAG TPA: serine hydrolase [Candidatus Acidoferrum sp.]|nr:serine hydrolase [Candidatus Acidoferrum sp.]
MRNSYGFFSQRWIRNAAALLLVGTALSWLGIELHSQRHVAEARLGKSDSPQSAQEERIRKIETTAVDIPMGDKEPLRLSLAQLMDLYKVPALSIAVIEDYKIAWAKGYGTIGTGSSAPVTTKTLFQAGSISKPVAATGALYLVEHGKLSLDEDVNVKLKSWKVPENEFTKDQKVTLRRLMSHTGGLTVHGFPGYDVDERMPTLVQIFNGEKPANTAPIRVDVVPGTLERYSGGGVTIEQQLMMDVTGKAFPELLRETVLDKIGMTDSSYAQPLPAARASMTAIGTYSDGKPVHGKWHVYPEMAAAGLWTTPTDLAKFAIEIANSRHGKSNHVLSQKMTEEMLTPVMQGAGLGFFVEKENPGQFGHNGADEGFQALLTMNSETGKGVAIMADSDNGITAASYVLRRLAQEYAWNYKFEGPVPTMGTLARARGVQAALDRYAEMKKSGELQGEQAERSLNQLGYSLLYSGHENDAITVFQRNVREFPQSSNVFDSLGEAYAKVGEKDLAIVNYEKSLQLDPKNQNALERLKKLRETK